MSGIIIRSEASEAYEERRYLKPLEQELKEKRKEVHQAFAAQRKCLQN